LNPCHIKGEQGSQGCHLNQPVSQSTSLTKLISNNY